MHRSSVLFIGWPSSKTDSYRNRGRIKAIKDYGWAIKEKLSVSDRDWNKTIVGKILVILLTRKSQSPF